jgi:hypothetical protein
LIGSSDLDPTVNDRDQDEQEQATVSGAFTLFYTKTPLAVTHLLRATANGALSFINFIFITLIINNIIIIIIIIYKKTAKKDIRCKIAPQLPGSVFFCDFELISYDHILFLFLFTF